MKWKIVGMLAVAIILAAVSVFFAYHTAGFKQEFKRFYVVCESNTITTSASGYDMSMNEPLDVAIRYVLKSDKSGYSVKVVPNHISEKDFYFSVDGNDYVYSEVSDLTKGFDIEYGEESFSIRPKGGISDVLKAVYEGNEVEDCTLKAYKDMCSLVITSNDGKQSVKINFTLSEEVAGIVLDREEIIF